MAIQSRINSMPMGVTVRRPSLKWSSALNFGDEAISLLAALSVSVLLARTLGPAQFGVYALVMAILSVSYVFAQVGIPSTVRRYVAELDGKGQHDVLGTVVGRALRIGLITALVAALLLATAAAGLATFFHQRELQTYLLLAAAMLVPMIGVGVLRSLLGGLQQYSFLLRLNLIISPLWLIGCGLALWGGARVAGVLFATLVAEVVTVVALWWRAQQQVGIHWNGRLPDGLRGRLVRYNLALAVLVFLNIIIWQRSELVFLARFSGPTQVSFYAIPFALTGRFGGLVPGAILGVLLPSLTYAQGRGDQPRFKALFGEALRYLAILTLPILLLGFGLASIIIGFLYGPSFTPAIVVFQILLISVIFTVLGQASQSALLGAESQSWLIKTGLVAAAVSIALDVLLIPRWGAIGAAVANTTVQALWALVVFVPLWRRLNMIRPRPERSLVGN
jgi:O-antigen/teichoic acid export membrane protein